MPKDDDNPQEASACPSPTTTNTATTTATNVMPTLTAPPTPKYTLLGLAGSGSFGRVYKARLTTTTTQTAPNDNFKDDRDFVAVKIVNGRVRLEAIAAEVRAMKRVSGCANVLGYRECFFSQPSASSNNHDGDGDDRVGSSEDATTTTATATTTTVNSRQGGAGDLWIVMEWAGGGSLRHYLSALYAAKAEGAVWWIVQQVLEALDAVHSLGITHHDIKAANVLVRSDGSICLGDFGLASTTSSLGDASNKSTSIWGGGGGSPYWMPPESLRSNHAPPNNPPMHARDIWSVGILAMELLCGAPPHAHLSPREAIRRITQQLPPRLADFEGGVADGCSIFSREMHEFVGVCVHEDPGKRPTAAFLLRRLFASRQVSEDRDAWLGLFRQMQKPCVDALLRENANVNANSNTQLLLLPYIQPSDESRTLVSEWTFGVAGAGGTTIGTATIREDLASLYGGGPEKVIEARKKEEQKQQLAVEKKTKKNREEPPSFWECLAMHKPQGEPPSEKVLLKSVFSKWRRSPHIALPALIDAANQYEASTSANGICISGIYRDRPSCTSNKEA